jgi:hypothetical protein
VAVVDLIGTKRRTASWPLLLIVFVLVPGVAAFYGNSAIFELFGNGDYLPSDSTGEHVLRWWDGWGRPLTVGTVAWLLLTARRVSPLASLMLAFASAAASFLWLYAALIVFLMLNPGAFD